MGTEVATINKKEYRFDNDDSWKKWKYILTDDSINFVDRANWYRENVMIDKPQTFVDTMKFIKYIDARFHFSEKQIKRFLKKSGKVGRGIRVSQMSADAIEFVVLKGMNGGITYSELDKVPFRKLLFFKRLLDVERQAMEDSYKK